MINLDTFTRTKVDGNVTFTDMLILPSGKQIHIGFQESITSKSVSYSIYLETTNKKKNMFNNYLVQNNEDGIEGLLWAKSRISDFEQELIAKIDEKDKRKYYIYCMWDNNKRRNIYHRGLRSLHYDYNRLYGNKVISKKIA